MASRDDIDTVGVTSWPLPALDDIISPLVTAFGAHGSSGYALTPANFAYARSTLSRLRDCLSSVLDHWDFPPGALWIMLPADNWSNDGLAGYLDHA